MAGASLPGPCNPTAQVTLSHRESMHIFGEKLSSGYAVYPILSVTVKKNKWALNLSNCFLHHLTFSPLMWNILKYNIVAPFYLLGLNLKIPRESWHSTGAYMYTLHSLLHTYLWESLVCKLDTVKGKTTTIK